MDFGECLYESKKYIEYLHLHFYICWEWLNITKIVCKSKEIKNELD